MNFNDKIYVAGHRGLVGSAIWKKLQEKGYHNLIGKTSKELDLEDKDAVENFFLKEKPDYVFLAAAHVGGILANNIYRADFLLKNLQIQNNVISSAYKTKVKKLLFLGSTCIYPKNAKQPISENELLTDVLEYTNEPYAIAKIAGLKLCESYNLQYGTNFISIMPTNLYGPNDNFDLEKSHVLPAMLRKILLSKALYDKNWDFIHKDLEKRPITSFPKNTDDAAIKAALAKFGIFEDRVELWGTGSPMREFLWSEEMAEACIFVMEKVDFQDLYEKEKEIRNTHINIGTGKDITISNLAQLIAKTCNYNGDIKFDCSKPDGTMRKLVDVSKINNLGWKHNIEIEEGINKIYEWYINQ